MADPIPITRDMRRMERGRPRARRGKMGTPLPTGRMRATPSPRAFQRASDRAAFKRAPTPSGPDIPPMNDTFRRMPSASAPSGAKKMPAPNQRAVERASSKAVFKRMATPVPPMPRGATEAMRSMRRAPVPGRRKMP